MLLQQVMLAVLALGLSHDLSSAAAPTPASAESLPSQHPAPTALRVERLLEPDALGIDTASPLFSWAFTAGSVRGQRASPPAVVSVALAPEELDARPLWRQQAPSSGPSGGGGAVLRYGGPALLSTTRAYWRVCTVGHASICATASFLTGQLAPETDWAGAEWIGGRQLRSPEISWHGKTVKSAVLVVSGLGFYECLLNGKKVGDAVMDPGFSTNYTERILYATWDVTAQLSAGGSAVLGARVGAGKYSYAVNPDAVPGKDVFALKAQLKLSFAGGGETLVLNTNSSWVAGPSPIVWEHLYHGEVFDARVVSPRLALFFLFFSLFSLLFLLCFSLCFSLVFSLGFSLFFSLCFSLSFSSFSVFFWFFWHRLFLRLHCHPNPPTLSKTDAECPGGRAARLGRPMRRRGLPSIFVIGRIVGSVGARQGGGAAGRSLGGAISPAVPADQGRYPSARLPFCCTPPLPSVGVSIGMWRGRQQNDCLADG